MSALNNFVLAADMRQGVAMYLVPDNKSENISKFLAGEEQPTGAVAVGYILRKPSPVLIAGDLGGNVHAYVYDRAKTKSDGLQPIAFQHIGGQVSKFCNYTH